MSFTAAHVSVKVITCKGLENEHKFSNPDWYIETK